MATKKNKNSDTVQERLADLLQKQNLTKADFARKIGVSNAHVANWLNGQLPRADQLLSISRFLGVTMEWLLTGKGEQTADEIISGAESFAASLGCVEMTGEQRTRARRVLQNRDVSITLAALEKRAESAEEQLKAAEAKLAAVRRALE